MSTPADLLRLLTRAPVHVQEATRTLRISQPTFSRWIAALGDEVLRARSGRQIRYARRRRIPQLGDPPLPIFEVDPQGCERHLADLHPIHPHGWWVEALTEDVASGFYEDLPWFLDAHRPDGFLGRELTRAHPEAGPADLRMWTAEHVLGRATQRGWDAPGALLVGERALERARAGAARPATSAAARGSAWPERATSALLDDIGSSATGEQPKFLAIVEGSPWPVPVLVKFSPPTATGPVARRTADLLLAEHHALATLRDHDQPAAISHIVEAGDRVFLEVERFDRVGLTGRVGLASLAAVDAQFVGSNLSAWTTATAALVAQGHLRPLDHRRARWLEQFSLLIHNTDRHFGNLSVRLRGATITGLAPAYDILPMGFAPRSGELVPTSFVPAFPSDAELAGEVLSAAVDFWARVGDDTRISQDFRHIADDALREVSRLQATGAGR